MSGVGACPDMLDMRGGCTDDVTIVGGRRSELKQCVAYTRPFNTSKTKHCIFL